MKNRRIPILIISWLCVVPLLGAPLDPDLEAEAKQIETLLIAPCCWRQPVSEHYSAAADQIRTEVREMLASGLTRDQILQKYVAEYGERILSKPPARGFNSLAYFLPVLFLAAGAGVAVLVVRRLRPAPVHVSADRPAESSKSKYASQLDKEMWG
jgi:cytochrome c-type biogenesis protein CcmH